MIKHLGLTGVTSQVRNDRLITIVLESQVFAIFEHFSIDYIAIFVSCITKSVIYHLDIKRIIPTCVILYIKIFLQPVKSIKQLAEYVILLC